MRNHSLVVLSSLALFSFGCNDNDNNNLVSPPPARSGDQQRMFNFPTAASTASTAPAGDVNNDGIGDIIVGDPAFDANRGRAIVYSGANGAPLWTLDNQAAGTTNALGAAVAGAGDVDGDGFGDVVVGAPGAAGAPVSGQAYVFSGQTGAEIYSLQEQGTPWRYGSVVTGLGDLNGDSVNDFAVGEPFAKTGAGTDTSFVYLYSGADGSQLNAIRVVPDADTGNGPNAIAGLDDLNGDGVPDILVAVDGPASFVYSGADGSRLRAHNSLATSAANFGDVNGDGVADYGLGYPTRQPGEVEVFSGADGSILRILRGSALDDGFGRTIAGVGDVNTDGSADILVGSDRGYARLISGVDGTGILDQRIGSDTSAHAVTSLGDLNGDGVQEYGVIVDGRVQVLSGADLQFTVDNHQISLSQGGKQTMFVRAGVQNAGLNYWVLGSATGTAPGTMIGPIVLPLTYDSYMQHTLVFPNQHIVASAGVLDTTGSADASITLPPGLSQALRGIAIYHASLVLTQDSILAGTNSAPLVLVE